MTEALSPKRLQDFLSNIAHDENGCWNWSAYIATTGYGMFRFRQRNTKAHRVSYVIHRGEIPAGLLVLHKCDNRKCVNPDHLFLGTTADNMRDMAQKGRAVKGSAHKLSRLTETQVVGILTLRQRFGVPCSRIANSLGVHPTTIELIVNGKTWPHVPRPALENKHA